MKVSDLKIEKELAGLKNVRPRDPNAAIRGRNLFLAEAKKLSQSVSIGAQKRHTEWNEKFQIQKRKGRLAMVSIISTILVAIALVFGGTGVVQAAQSSLPSDSLYPVKLWTEDFTASFTSNPESLIDLYMSFADRRIEEIAGENQAGTTVQESVISRFLAEIESILQLTGEVPDADLEPIFMRIRDRLQTQDRLLQQLQTLATDQNEPLMISIHQRIQERLMLVEAGMGDPIQLRDQIRQQLRLQDQLNAPTDAQPGQMNGETNGNGSYQITPPPAGTGGNSFGDGTTSGSDNGNGGTGQQNNCTCQPTPTGTVVDSYGTPSPTPCTCPLGSGSGFGNQGTPMPGSGGNGQGGKP